jgi:hypothetical protein
MKFTTIPLPPPPATVAVRDLISQPGTVEIQVNNSQIAKLDNGRLVINRGVLLALGIVLYELERDGRLLTL